MFSWTPCSSSDIRCCCHSNGNTVTCLHGAPHTDPGDPTLQGNPFRTIHRHHSPCADSHRNAECRVAASVFCFGGSPHRTCWCTSLSVRRGIPPPQNGDVCGATCSTCPSACRAVAHTRTRRARRTARCAHRTPPRCRKKRDGRQTHTSPTAPTTLVVFYSINCRARPR